MIYVLIKLEQVDNSWVLRQISCSLYIIRRCFIIAFFLMHINYMVLLIMNIRTMTSFHITVFELEMFSPGFRATFIRCVPNWSFFLPSPVLKLKVHKAGVGFLINQIKEIWDPTDEWGVFKGKRWNLCNRNKINPFFSIFILLPDNSPHNSGILFLR